MDNYILLLIAAGAGFAAHHFWMAQKDRQETDGLKAEAKKTLESAKNEKEQILDKTRTDADRIITEARKDEETRRKEITELQKRTEQRENTFAQKLLDLQDKQQEVYQAIQKIEKAKEKLKTLKEEQDLKLQEIAKMTKEEAVEAIVNKAREENDDAIMARIKKLEAESSDIWESRAKSLIIDTCQRIAHSVTSEFTSTSVDLPNDEMKGRIIGKEGRNIKTVEKLTGTEIMIDDTPNVLTVSGFSLIRRHIAKKTLEKLILDGRIQPAKIEEAVQASKQELALEMKKAGEDALYEVGITGLDPKLVQIIGRLKYRTSYGQNCLLHAMQVAQIAGFLAEELKLNIGIAKKAGMLHDIGKAVDQEMEGTHPQIGGDIARKFNVPQEIIDPIETHHDDHPKGIMSVLVKVADAISGARRGARNDSFEKYLQRLGDLEQVARSLPGIEKVYAIQAGREVRVFVVPEVINDVKAHELARDIAKKIEKELQYPGEIKVTVIRETRAIEYAR